MTNKLTPASGTNQFKEIGGGQGLRKTIGIDYITSSTYNGVFEFAKAQNKYYSESTAHSRAEVYQPWLAGRTRITEADHTILEQVSKHTLELLVNTCKEEVNNNILLRNQLDAIKNELIKYKDNSVILKLELKQMSKRYTTRLEQAEKNRKDPHHREQLIKYSLIMLAGFLLFGLINYL